MIFRVALSVALCAASPGLPQVVGSAVALNAEAGVPEWVQLFPMGRLVVGRDGRRFSIPDPAAIVAATKAYLPLVIDYEHDFELRQPGQDTPAAGWIEEIEVRELGGIWGRVSWADKAASAIRAKEYRFLSPVLLHRANTDPMEVVALASVGLTHRPNLDLKALNRAVAPAQEDPVKDLLIKLLGLKEAATDAEIVAAVNSLKADHEKALNGARLDAEKYVPKAQHDETVAALNQARATIAERDEADRKAKAAALIDEAIAGGRLAPAAREGYLALALNSFEATKKALDAMPSIVRPGEAPAPKSEAAAGGALTADEKALCTRLGVTEDQFRKAAA